LQKLHNTRDGRYSADVAKLFARYLEDHTGLGELFPGDFDDRRRRFEDPGLDWEKDGPTIISKPYVVMELVNGEALHVAIDREWRQQQSRGQDLPRMSLQEKRDVLLQATRALEYLATFGLIHRDFRGCNIHLEERESDEQGCRLKVLDLGVMITDEDRQQTNTNDAVQAFRKRGDTEEKKKRYDWLPWEVRAAADGTGPPLNFEKPIYSFDMFSLGVLALHLLIGRVEARELLARMERDMNMSSWSCDTNLLGLDPALHRRMVGVAAQRPTPSEVLKSLEVNLALPERKAELGRQMPRAPVAQRPDTGPEVTLSRTRSSSLSPSPPPLRPTRIVQRDVQLGYAAKAAPQRLLVPPRPEGTNLKVAAPKTAAPRLNVPKRTGPGRGPNHRGRSRSCSYSEYSEDSFCPPSLKRVREEESMLRAQKSARPKAPVPRRAEVSDNFADRNEKQHLLESLRSVRAAVSSWSRLQEDLPSTTSSCWVLTFPLEMAKP